MPTQKPSEFPDWATDPQTSPISGQQNFTPPPAEKQQFGWNYREIPPRQWFNWWMRVVGLWIRWINENVSQTVMISDNYVASRAQLKLLANTSEGSFDVTLPESPNEGDEIEIFDAANTFFDRPVAVLRNGKLIQGESEDIIVDEPHVKFLYVSDAIGWRVF